MGKVFDSPFMVPVAAFAMVVGIILIVNITNYHLRKLRSRERLAAIEKGLPLPDDSPIGFVDPRRAAARTRLTAIILISVGIGTAAAFGILAWVVEDRDVLSAAAFAVIPLAIGVGMMIDYRMQIKALEAMGNEKSLQRLPA